MNIKSYKIYINIFLLFENGKLIFQFVEEK